MIPLRLKSILGNDRSGELQGVGICLPAKVVHGGMHLPRRGVRRME